MELCHDNDWLRKRKNSEKWKTVFVLRNLLNSLLWKRRMPRNKKITVLILRNDMVWFFKRTGSQKRG